MQAFSNEAFVAAAEEDAWAWRTLSVNTSEEIGGREVTRRFKLYRLWVVLDYKCEGKALNLLPVRSHMTPLQLTVSERNLAGIAGIWVRRSDICGCSSLRRRHSA